MQHKEGTWEGFTAAYGCKRLPYFEREKKLNLIRTINPEFEDFAQIWGWKMITVHEKIYP